MNRAELQNLSRLRVREAKVLLNNQCYSGAYYLIGYAVECALKSCIAKQIQRHDFPDKKLLNDVYTHDLEKLLNVSGLKVQLQNEVLTNPAFALNWTKVKDWSEQSRYSVTISQADAEELFQAVTARKNGILTWLKRWW
jgi:HEPN domain-containing protein